MKNLALYFCLFTLSVVLTNCKDDNNMDNDLPQTKYTLVVNSGEVVIHPIADAIPVEGGFRISKQAKNFNTSEIKVGGEQAAIAYHYQSKPRFKGTETVKIISSYSIGDGNLIDNGVIVLTIEVK